MDLTFRRSTMDFDCAGCPVRGRHCDDCVVATFLGMPTITTTGPADLGSSGRFGPGREQDRAWADETELLAEERATVRRLVAAGLLAPEEAAGLRAEIVADPWQWQTG